MTSVRKPFLCLTFVGLLGCQGIGGPQDGDHSSSRRGVFDRSLPTDVDDVRHSHDMGEPPVVTVTNEFLDPMIVQGTLSPPTIVDARGGTSWVFCWTGESGDGGSAVAAYRYGWDIVDLNDDEQWETGFIASDGSEVCAPPRAFLFGTHTFNLEVVDANDEKTRVIVWLNVVPKLAPFYLDVRPGGCPNPLTAKSRGLLPVAILAEEGADLLDIDVSTVQLSPTIAPIRSDIEDVGTPVTMGLICTCNDHGSDGTDDLTLKFRTQDVLNTLGPFEGIATVPLTLRGNLHDGTYFEITDCVVVVGGGYDKDEGPLGTLP